MIPKFRFYDKKYGVWINPECVWLDEKGNFRGIDGVNRFESFDDKDIIPMQSTGLFDNSEPPKEIFEGDVVKLQYTIASDFELFEVHQFRGGMWRIDNRRRGSELWLRNEDCEVIGNIYEHQHLLEEAK